jgi:glycosidase
MAARLLLAAMLLTVILPTAPLDAALPPARATLDNPASVTLAGNLQSELGCPGDWQPGCATTNLTLVGNGVWRGSFTVPAGTRQYKIALNAAWDESYPAANRTLTVAAPTEVRFYYDQTTHAVLDSINEHNRIAVVAGNFQSELGCPGDWQPGCVASLMSDADGDGTFTFATSALPPGAYELKVALNESWETSYPAVNVPFTIAVAGQMVTVSWNTTTNAVSTALEALTAAQDNHVEYPGLAHDSRGDRYRLPFGAVTSGTPVTLRFRTFHNDVTSVRVRISDPAGASHSLKRLMLAASDADCAATAPLIKTCDFWTTTITPTQRGVLSYRFIVADGGDTAFYEDDARLDGGLGEALPATRDRSYTIAVYAEDFATPDWARNATIYQIFVERFRNGDATNDPTGNPATDRGWFYPAERGRRFPVTPWNTIVPDPEPYTDPSREYWATSSSTMYGGDLIGVTQKISDGYFGQLGVTALYLTPIFDSPSNHKDDGRDYRQIDSAFGGRAAFDQLIQVAHAHGLKVILGGVPDHVSSDSPFFDRFGRHPEVGACESLSSPYRSWFFFEPAAPAGTGACAGDTQYRGWRGVATLPQINTAHPAVLAYWFGTPGGNPNLPSATAGYWIEQGADGWGIDRAPDIIDLSPTFFETWRATIKAANPDAALYAGTWAEAGARDRRLGDEFDGTLNYRYRKAVLGLLRATPWTDNDGVIAPLAPSQFASAFAAMREDYPRPAFDTALNLIDSHDTNRAVHVLNELGFTGAGYDRQPVDGFADARQRLGQAAVLQMTLPGAPAIYYGDEVGLTGFGYDVPRDDPYNRQPYPWSDAAGYASLPAWRQAQGDLLAHYRAAGQLRRDHSFLRTGSFDLLRADDANKVLAYGRKDASGAAIVVFNRGSTAQTINLDLAGYVPAGTVLARALPSGGASLPPTSAATYAFSLPAQGYGVWITPPGVDLTPPPAPATLAATPGNGIVGLSWGAAPAASSYNIYRSLLPGGGYERIGSATASAFTDTTVTNGRRYYYVVKAVDGAGNEGQPSPEATATPAFPVGYAVLQWPPTINHTVGAAPTTPIYGRAFVAGITDVNGDPALIRAEVGFGPNGSSPASWTGWRPMAFNAQAGNIYEYQGTLRPEQAGNFDLLVRFSTDGGLTWAYGDLDGFFPGEPGTDAPASLTVISNGDLDPPAAPADLRVADWGADLIALRWQPVADAALYRLYRSTITGTFDFNAPLAELAAPTLAYTDTQVDSGIRYHYVVKAFDAALNPSAPSNAVSQLAAPRPVTVVFNLAVPPGTPGTPTVAGNNVQAFGKTWNPGHVPLTQVGPNAWRYQATVLDGTLLEYTYARGSWEKAETAADGASANRLLNVEYGTDGTVAVTDTVANWRDPFVLSHWPAAGATGIAVTAPVSVTWNHPMPPAADFTVAGAGGPVSGTFAYDSASRATSWTPAAPLDFGTTYTVTVASELDVNGNTQQVPTVWSFQTVPAPLSFALSPGAAGSGAAGAQVHYSLTLTNTGQVSDSYALTRSGGLWPASFPPSVGPLAPGQSATIQVTVTVPADAAVGASDSLTLTARSQALSSLAQSIQLTTRAATRRLFVPLIQRAP